MAQHATAKVLTVEDDPIVRADLRLILEEAGFEVCPEARDGIEAVERAREHRPDLVVLDLGLPKLDGAEAARQILDEREVPIVALTGHRNGELLERAVAAGATGYVLKPFTERALLGTLRDVLGERAARQHEERHLRVMIEQMVREGYPGPEIARAVQRALGKDVEQPSVAERLLAWIRGRSETS